MTLRFAQSDSKRRAQNDRFASRRPQAEHWPLVPTYRITELDEANRRGSRLVLFVAFVSAWHRWRLPVGLPLLTFRYVDLVCTTK